MEDDPEEDELLALRKQNAELKEQFQLRNDAEDKEVRELFPDLPSTEHVIDYFACALSAKILLQGWMYITQNYICFSCNLLVYKTKHCFEIKDVVKLTKSRHAGVNPGFCIQFEGGRKVSFFSFFDRDKAMMLITKLSQSARGEGEHEDEQEDEFVFEDAVAAISAEGESAFPEARIPPEEPAFTNPIYVCEFPMSTREAFVLLYSSQSTFTDKSKKHEGSSEIMISAWDQPTGREGWIRELNFRYPLDGIPMCPPSTMVHEVQHCRFCPESENLVLSYSVQSLDVPYGTYFTVETRHQFKPKGEHCELSISMEVRFSKSTFLQSKIASNTLSRESERWKEWCLYAKDYVERKKGLKRSAKKELVARRPIKKQSGKDTQQVQNTAVVCTLALLVLVLILLVEIKVRGLIAQVSS